MTMDKVLKILWFILKLLPMFIKFIASIGKKKPDAPDDDTSSDDDTPPDMPNIATS